jgi:hypothetical protein
MAELTEEQKQISRSLSILAASGDPQEQELARQAFEEYQRQNGVAEGQRLLRIVQAREGLVRGVENARSLLWQADGTGNINPVDEFAGFQQPQPSALNINQPLGQRNNINPVDEFAGFQQPTEAPRNIVDEANDVFSFIDPQGFVQRQLNQQAQDAATRGFIEARQREAAFQREQQALAEQAQPQQFVNTPPASDQQAQIQALQSLNVPAGLPPSSLAAQVQGTAQANQIASDAQRQQQLDAFNQQIQQAVIAQSAAQGQLMQDQLQLRRLNDQIQLQVPVQVDDNLALASQFAQQAQASVNPANIQQNIATLAQLGQSAEVPSLVPTARANINQRIQTSNAQERVDGRLRQAELESLQLALQAFTRDTVRPILQDRRS